jgi:hypothetical protein
VAVQLAPAPPSSRVSNDSHHRQPHPSPHVQTRSCQSPLSPVLLPTLLSSPISNGSRHQIRRPFTPTC